LPLNVAGFESLAAVLLAVYQFRHLGIITQSCL